jgi:acylphosphatase
MTIARRVRVTGRVQGVFFRAWTRDEAKALGVTGWVRNDADGSVEAFVEGSDGAVAKMIALIGQGPSHANVDNVEVEEADPEGFDRFEVRH